jgi:hypothetical protein
MSGAPGRPRPARPVVLGLVVLLAAALTGASQGPVGPPPTATGWAGFEAERTAMIRNLAGPVLACIGRFDPRARDSAMFHGCGDWHNALAGHYALYTAYLHTGDATYLRAAETLISADRVAAEAAFLPQLERPNNWRRTYGFPWLLAMVEQRAHAWALAAERGDGPVRDPAVLDSLAGEAASWLLHWMTQLDDAQAREAALADRYTNLSWMVLNLVRWARHTDNENLLDAARWVAETHLRTSELDAACPVGRDAGADATGFIPPCLTRLAVFAAIDGAAAHVWINPRIPSDFSIPPLTAPRTAEATGLNFHRAAMLATLFWATGRISLRDNAATLIRFHTARPHQWRYDYRQHSQWIPQFGIHAIEQTYPPGL